MKHAIEQLKFINRDNWRETLIQFIKFGLIGVSNTLVSTATYYLFYFINHDLYLVGNTVGWIVSVLNSFFWNNKFVFQGSEFGVWKKLLRTYMAYGGSFLLGTVLMWIQVSLLGVPGWLAPWTNMVITIPLNFFMNKFWAFKA